MQGLHRITTNLGPIYELKNSRFLGPMSSRLTCIGRLQASIYIDVGERLTYKKCIIGQLIRVTCDRSTTDLRAHDPRTPFISLSA